jgi:hypothetical protein
MKTIIALPLLVLGLAACEPHPQRARDIRAARNPSQDPSGYPYPPGPSYI